MKDEKQEPNEEAEYPHWNRVYFTVIVFTAVLITVLWYISKQFQ